MLVAMCPMDAGARMAGMRGWIIGGVAVLAACGLVLFLALRSGGPSAPEGSADASLERKRSTHPGPTAERAARGEGGTLPTSQPPGEADGVLDVEVLAGGKPSLGTSVR